MDMGRDVDAIGVSPPRAPRLSEEFHGLIGNHAIASAIDHGLNNKQNLLDHSWLCLPLVLSGSRRQALCWDGPCS
jgi:hypothetical protein